MSKRALERNKRVWEKKSSLVPSVVSLEEGGLNKRQGEAGDVVQTVDRGLMLSATIT